MTYQNVHVLVGAKVVLLTTMEFSQSSNKNSCSHFVMLLVVYYRNLASRHAAFSSDDFAPYECSSNDYQTTII